jgi:hypothetical protein
VVGYVSELEIYILISFLIRPRGSKLLGFIVLRFRRHDHYTASGEGTPSHLLLVWLVSIALERLCLQPLQSSS